MNKMISVCGLDCEKCDAFIATKNNDQALREKTAKLEIRKCAISKNYETCGDCPEMEHCHKLGAIHANNKDAKNRLKKA